MGYPTLQVVAEELRCLAPTPARRVQPEHRVVEQQLRQLLRAHTDLEAVCPRLGDDVGGSVQQLVTAHEMVQDSGDRPAARNPESAGRPTGYPISRAGRSSPPQQVPPWLAAPPAAPVSGLASPRRASASTTLEVPTGTASPANQELAARPYDGWHSRTYSRSDDGDGLVTSGAR